MAVGDQQETGQRLTKAEQERVSVELAAIRAERRDQFEMLATFERLQRPDSILNRPTGRSRRWVV